MEFTPDNSISFFICYVASSRQENRVYVNFKKAKPAFYRNRLYWSDIFKLYNTKPMARDGAFDFFCIGANQDITAIVCAPGAALKQLAVRCNTPVKKT